MIGVTANEGKDHIMNQNDPERVRARVHQVACRQAKLPEAVAKDVAFHMTDWLANLEAYHRFCTNPDALPDSEVNRLLIEFFVHVPNHVAAAGKLYTDIPVTDVFGVDAISEDKI